MKYFEKTALNASKARQLATKAGLIPHPESQWKWGLRKMRNMKSGQLLEGKELSKAKESIGKLKNNDFQKLKGASRKGRLGQEFALTKSKDINIGEKGGVADYRKWANPTIAHTHPEYDKVKDMLLFKNKNNDLIDKNEISRLLNKTTDSSPSGLNPYYSPKTPFYKKTYKKSSPDVKRFIDENFPGLKTKQNILSKISKTKIPFISTLSNKKLSKSKNYRDQLVNDLRSKTSLGGDADSLKDSPKLIQNIVSPQTTGVHKYNPKLPKATRSVYFKGGL